MIPWASEPDMWIDLKTFCRLFNYSYKGEAVNSKLLRTGAMADFGFQAVCIILPGRPFFKGAHHWYIRLKD